ncbi:MAG: thioredoxin-dependent thiol peroxidase [Cyclobacteriaceae bacterium]
MMLEKGEKAPEFEGIDQDGNTIKSSDFSDKKIVLYFYPKDNTPGCTAQACNLRDNYQSLLAQGYVVIGVSQDSTASHKKFIEKQNLPFPLIADTDHVVHNLFGVWGEKKMYGKTYMGTLRTTFIIDEQGIIEEVIAKVKTKDHTAQILV